MESERPPDRGGPCGHVDTQRDAICGAFVNHDGAHQWAARESPEGRAIETYLALEAEADGRHIMRARRGF